MILTRPEDTLHKIQLLRLLNKILDEPILSGQIYFKGGSCASMLGYLDRFSVDLDFDLDYGVNKKDFDTRLKIIFKNLGLKVKQKSRNELFYVLKYQSKAGQRDTLKLGLLKKQADSNIYKPFYLKEIDRFAVCQTIETMFAHKLVSPIDRYKKHKMIAGRDIYDIHHFFLEGFHYLPKVIRERTQKQPAVFLKDLRYFIEKKVDDKIISQDLNYLLPYDKFKMIRNILKIETILALDDEIRRLKARDE